MRIGVRLSALTGALMVSAFGAGAAAASDIVVPVQDAEETWLFAPGDVTVTPDGIRRARVLAVWAVGKPLGSRVVRVVDGVVDFNCETGQFRPVSVRFLDAAMDQVAAGEAPPADAPWIAATPSSRFGLTRQAVCHPEAVAPAARRSADSLEKAAGVLVSGFD